MSRTLFLIISIVTLAVMNAVLLVMLWQAPGNDLSIHDKRKHPPHNKQPFVNVIADDLNLDNVQQEKLKELARHHHSGMMKMDKEQRILVKAYFSSLLDSLDGAERSRLEEEIKRVEFEKVQFTYDHFQDIKNLCSPEQLEKFPMFLEKAIKVLLMAPPKPPKGKRPKPDMI